MVNHGWPWSIYQIWLPLTIIWPWLLTMVDHGQPWSFKCLLTMKWPSFDHGFLHGWWWSWYYWLTMVNHGWPWSIYRIWLPLTIIWPWLMTMVDHGHDHRSILQTWSTMVRPWSIDGHFMVNISDLTTIDHHMTMTNDHGRPWSWPSFHFTNMVDHGQTMVNWWSFHGRPWSMTMILLQGGHSGKSACIHGTI